MAHLKGSLPPEPFPLDDSAQRLTAGRAAKPLAGAAPGRREVLIAAGTIAAKKFGAVGWALTLALRLRDFFGSGLLRLPPLADPLAIPTTLLTAAVAPTLRLPPSLAGTPMPPAVRCILTHRTAIPRLDIFGLKELLAVFQQTAAPPWRLTGALP